MSASQFEHRSVLFAESIDALNIHPDGIYIDATFGRGGHSAGILEKLSANGRLLAFDKDPQAIESAKRFVDDKRFEIFHRPFAEMLTVIQSCDLVGEVDGILMDIGVSSPQLDDATRGFSFMNDGPLDMRMDTSSGLTAAQWLNCASLDEITHVIKVFGEEKFGKRIATAVVDYRQQRPITTTKEFVKIIKAAMPVKDKHKHPATRTFQGVRIFINGELDELETAMEAATEILKPAGRLAVISFHSLEDRMVKRFIKAKSQGERLPSRLPVLQSQIDKSKILKPIGKAIKAGATELRENPRARSAVLRVAEKL